MRRKLKNKVGIGPAEAPTLLPFVDEFTREEWEYSSEHGDREPTIEGWMLFVDRELAAVCTGWTLPNADDYLADVEKISPTWRSFAVLEYSARPGVTRHRWVCGRVRG